MLNIVHVLISGTLKFMALTMASLLTITFIHVERLSALFRASYLIFPLPLMELALCSWFPISPLICGSNCACGQLHTEQNYYLLVYSYAFFWDQRSTGTEGKQLKWVKSYCELRGVAQESWGRGSGVEHLCTCTVSWFDP